MPCPRCGTENRSDARYCRACGMRLETAAAPADPNAASLPAPADTAIEFPDDFRSASRLAAQATAEPHAGRPPRAQRAGDGGPADPTIEFPDDFAGASQAVVQAATGTP